MKKLKNLSLVSNTSKLYSENKDSYIFLRIHDKKNNNIKEMTKNERKEEILDVNGNISEKKLILYKKPLMGLEITNFLTRIYESYGTNSVDLTSCCSRDLLEKRKHENCTALVPWLRSSRALIPYMKESPNDVSPTIKLLQEILKNSLQNAPPKSSQMPSQEKTEIMVNDDIQGNPSKFAVNLSEIWGEMEIIENIPPRNDVTFGISRNCQSCPAVVSIKSFTTKFLPRRNESKVLLLTCDNFAKFEKTFTKLVAKNKIRNVKPLLRNVENKEEILTRIEKALVNHNLRMNKNCDIIKRNVITIQSSVMENMKEQLNANDNSTENTYDNLNSNLSNDRVRRTKKSSNIMIVNDEIFKETKLKSTNKIMCNIPEERNNILFLNNVIFKELEMEKVNKIMNRKYTNYKDTGNEILVRIPTRETSKKLKPSSSTNEKVEDYQEIPLENLIAAVADKKRLEYIDRSQMNWKVFKEFEKTMEKVTILDFPPPEEIPFEENQHISKKAILNTELSKRSFLTTNLKSVQETEEPMFQKYSNSESPQKKENVGIQITKKEKVKEIRVESPHTIISASGKRHQENLNTHQTNMIGSIDREKVKSEKGGSIKLINKTKDKELETKLNKDKTKSQKSLKSKQPRIVKMNTSALSKAIGNANQNTIITYKSNINPDKKEHKVNSSPLKYQETTHTTTKNKNNKRKTSNSSTTKHETKKERNTLQSPTNTAKKSATREYSLAKEEFINIKNKRKLSFDEQKHWSIKEKEEETPLIFLHKNKMKPMLSTSHFEVIEDLVEKPKMKKIHSQNDIFREKIPSRGPATEGQVKEEKNTSIYPSKIGENKKSPEKKAKSKSPILGTPTTIIKQIKTNVATALATNELREIINEEENEEKMNKIIEEKSRRKKKIQEKTQSAGPAPKNEGYKGKLESNEVASIKSKADRIQNDSKDKSKIEINKINHSGIQEETPLICLHKNPTKSMLSTSHYEVIEDLVENPKLEKTDLHKDLLRQKIYSRDPAIGQGTEDKNNSIYPSKIEANKKPPGKKDKSKLPILGTPTTITKQIEKIVAKPSTTNKLNEEENEENMNNLIEDNSRRRNEVKQEKLKSVEPTPKNDGYNTKRKPEQNNVSCDKSKTDRIQNDSKSQSRNEIESMNETSRLGNQKRTPIICLHKNPRKSIISTTHLETVEDPVEYPKSKGVNSRNDLSIKKIYSQDPTTEGKILEYNSIYTSKVEANAKSSEKEDKSKLSISKQVEKNVSFTLKSNELGGKFNKEKNEILLEENSGKQKKVQQEKQTKLGPSNTSSYKSQTDRIQNDSKIETNITNVGNRLEIYEILAMNSPTNNERVNKKPIEVKGLENKRIEEDTTIKRKHALDKLKFPRDNTDKKFRDESERENISTRQNVEKHEEIFMNTLENNQLEKIGKYDINDEQPTIFRGHEKQEIITSKKRNKSEMNDLFEEINNDSIVSKNEDKGNNIMIKNSLDTISAEEQMENNANSKIITSETIMSANYVGVLDEKILVNKTTEQKKQIEHNVESGIEKHTDEKDESSIEGGENEIKMNDTKAKYCGNIIGNINTTAFKNNEEKIIFIDKSGTERFFSETNYDNKEKRAITSSFVSCKSKKLTKEDGLHENEVKNNTIVFKSTEKNYENPNQQSDNKNSISINDSKKKFAEVWNKTTESSLREFSLDKTEKFSTKTCNPTDLEIQKPDKMNEMNSLDNFMEEYFSEKQIEDLENSAKKSKLEKNELSEKIKEDISGIEENETKDITKDHTVSIADPEMIRKKRLIYFGDVVRNKHQVKESEVDKKINSRLKTSQVGNRLKRADTSNSIQPESSFENELQTPRFDKQLENSGIQTDQTTEKTSFIENEESKEKQSLSSQYECQPNIHRSEKAIETKTEHKDAAVNANNEISQNETEKSMNHKILKKSVSDNVIIIKAARTDSEETVESIEGITKSFLKQLQAKMNLVQTSKLKNQTMQKCREIAVKLKKSQEKFVRNIPSNFYKICQEAKKIKNKLSRTKIMTKKSREIINKFTNTFTKNTIDSANQAELKETRGCPNKQERKYKSAIERKVTSKMKLLTRPTNSYKKKKNVRNIKPKSTEGTQIERGSPPSLSTTDLQNKSIGSLFADTVASALAQCGDVDKIMSKYSDSMENISSNSRPNTNYNRPPSGEQIQEFTGEIVQKEDEFMMSDGVRKLIINVSLEKNKDDTMDDEWKCVPKGISLKNSDSKKDNQIVLNKSESNTTTNEPSSCKKLDTTSQEELNPFFPLLDSNGKSPASSNDCLQEQRQNNFSNHNHREEAEALEETKQDLTELKKLLQQEKERNNSEIYCEDEEIEIFKNNDTFKLKFPQEEPKSIEDLHKDLLSERDTRKAEGSTLLPPQALTENSSFQEIISNGPTPTDLNDDDAESHMGQVPQCTEAELEKNESESNSSTLDLKEIDVIPKYLTLNGADSKEVHSPEVFVTPLTSNTDFTESSESLEPFPTSNPTVSKNSPLSDEEDNKIIDEDRYDQLQYTTSGKPHANEKQGILTRKEEIELSCKLSHFPNSLVCRESRKNIVNTVLEKCESLEQKVQKVLGVGHKDDNLKEIFIDIERMSNCILKAVSSIDTVSNDEPTVSKIGTLQNYKRTFATNNTSGNYSRFEEWKQREDKVDTEKDKYDSETSNKINDESLPDGTFFSTNKRRKKEINEDDRDETKRSIYHAIVRKSEEPVKTEEIGYLHLERGGKPSEESKKPKLDTDIEYIKDGDIDGITFEISSAENQGEPILQNTEREIEKRVEGKTEENVFEGRSEHNSASYHEENSSNPCNEDDIEVVFETVEDYKGAVFDTGKGENATSVEEGTMSQVKKTDLPSEDTKHKILAKFAKIHQEHDSPIFQINNDVKFDLSRKRMCQPDIIVPNSRIGMQTSSHKGTEDNMEKPLMIIKLSPSRELYKPPVPKMSDTELKNLLLQNPKMLMRIASDIMSKNQYLSFLLDLKSTKELREYWMNKIKEGILSSRSVRDLTKVMDYFNARSVKENTDENLVQTRKSKISEDRKENKSDTSLGLEHETKTKEESSESKSMKSNSVGETKTTLDVEKDQTKVLNRRTSPSSLQKKMLERNIGQDKNSRRNLSFQNKDAPQIAPLSYSLEKYLESSPKINEVLKGNDESSTLLRISKNLHGKEVEMEITHEDLNVKLVKEHDQGEKILPMKRRVGKYLFKLSEELSPILQKQENCKKINIEKNKTISRNIEKNIYIKNTSMRDQNEKNICDLVVKPGVKRAKEYQVKLGERHNEKKGNPQQTAIVLPGREPIKVSLISNENSASPKTSIKNYSEKSVLENLSDVLSNCSSPVSSLGSKGGKPVLKKRNLKKPGFKKNGIQRSNTLTTINSSMGNNSLKSSQITPSDGLTLKKFENPLKEFVRNQEDSRSSTKDQLSKMKEKGSHTCLTEAKKIRVIRAKSLSEVLKDDPDFLKKIREKKMLESGNKEEDATKKFEYRFHDFRRKEDKNSEIRAKRQEEQKRDLLNKFKCLIEARKIASERNRQNVRPNENQQIQPKVFSKILEKISYFKELEDQPNTERKWDPVESEKNVSPSRQVVDAKPRVINGSRRMLHTKRKQINEDELVTWVQEIPAVPVKRVAMENVENNEEGKQNVIHIPWTPTFHQVDAQI